MMVDKGLNLFDECVAKCVHLYPQVQECSYKPDAIANSQRMPTIIKNNGAIAKVRIFVKQVIL